MIFCLGSWEDITTIPGEDWESMNIAVEEVWRLFVRLGFMWETTVISTPAYPGKIKDSSVCRSASGVCEPI